MGRSDPPAFVRVGDRYYAFSAYVDAMHESALSRFDDVLARAKSVRKAMALMASLRTRATAEAVRQEALRRLYTSGAAFSMADVIEAGGNVIGRFPAPDPVVPGGDPVTLTSRATDPIVEPSSSEGAKRDA